MATIESVMSGARTVLRDFPRFFTSTVSKTDNVRTFELPHENIATGDLDVWAVSPTGSTTYQGVLNTSTYTPSTSTFSYVLDVRNGLLRVKTPPTGGFATGSYINIEGYYYEWVSDPDLRYHATNIIAEHLVRRDMKLEDVSDAEEDAMALGTVVDALWSLLLEFSRDIDVNTPEAIGIPSSQRYRQVEDLLFNPNGFLAKYKEKCRMLGVGLDRIEVMTLRRVSRQTNRLVPIYKEREWDDNTRPKREFPAVDQQAPSTPPSEFVPARVVTGFDDFPQAYPNP